MPKTGATRYQKFLKSERAKTKLKSKELPKGTNITKTNFKVKKIVIREQLKAHGEDEAITRKKLNLKELLLRLNHFNVNSRTEGLNGIRELVSTHKEVLDLHLGQLVHGVTPLVLNVDKTVRRESLKVIHLMLTNASIEKISPFFDVLCTYLRCAMTHIDNRIQEDSLLFLDVLLLCTPDKVAADFYKIIPNFIDMISKLRVDSKPGRTLTVNLNSQMTSSKWRVKVLHRLQELLDRFVKRNKLSSRSNTGPQVHYFRENKEQVYPLNNDNCVANCYLPCFFAKSGQAESTTEDEGENFKKYCDTLLPLLFETWLEVCPNNNQKSDKNMETVVSEEAAALLKHLLEVIDLLWRYVQILNKNNHTSNIAKWFCDKFRRSYSQHIANVFPYSTVIRARRDQTSSLSDVFTETITDQKMVNENLKICYLYIKLNENLNIKELNPGKVLNYIEKMFSKNKEDGNNASIMRVLNSLFSAESSAWSQSPMMEPLFEKIVASYFSGKAVGFHQDIFTLLCKISLNHKLSKFHKTPAFDRWLSHLPDILCCESISSPTIDILHKFATQNTNIFNATVKPKLQAIVQNLPLIKTDINEKESKTKLLSLLYWIKGWDEDSLNILEDQLKVNAYGNDKCKFIVDMLKFKSQGAY